MKEKKTKKDNHSLYFTSIACCSGNRMYSWLPDELIQTPVQEKKTLFKQEI